jgi:hypothetical protein
MVGYVAFRDICENDMVIPELGFSKTQAQNI